MQRKFITSLKGKKITDIAWNTKKGHYVFYTGIKKKKAVFTVGFDEIFDGEGMHFENDAQLTVNL